MEKQKQSSEKLAESGKSQKKLVNISLQTYREMTEMSLSISHLYLLELSYNEQYNKIDSINDILKVKGYLQHMIRKDYMTDEYKLTTSGRELYEKLVAESENKDYIPKKTNKTLEQLFEEWWAEYPKTTHWNSGARIFQGDRALKIKKQQCRDKYIKILDEGFKHEDLVKALKYELKVKKEMSVKSGVNKMEYMKSTESYLNARVFENFIDQAKSTVEQSDHQVINL